MQSLLYVYAGIVFLNMGMNRKVFFGYVSGVVLGIGLLLSSCGKAGGRENHSAEADSLNTLSYELRYKDLTASARAAGKAYSFAEGHPAQRAEALNNMAFCAFMRMDFEQASQLYRRAEVASENEVEALIADVGMMRVCQRTSLNKEFYDYRNNALRRIRRIREYDEALADERLNRRFNYALSEFYIVSGVYYYYLQQDEAALRSIQAISEESLKADTSQWLYYVYMRGSGGMYEAPTPDEVTLGEFECLVQCLQVSRMKDYIYFEANSLQAMAELLCMRRNRTLLEAKSPGLLRLVNEDDLPVDSLPLRYAEEALRLFKQYGDWYQISGAYRTLATCYNFAGIPDKALPMLAEALEFVNRHHEKYYHCADTTDRLHTYVPFSSECIELKWINDEGIKTVPEWIARLREQLSRTYAAMDRKPESDYNRNIYLDILDYARQDKELESRYAVLERESKQLNVLLALVVAGLLLLVVCFIFLNRRWRKRNTAYLSELRKVLDLCHRITGGVPVKAQGIGEVTEVLRQILKEGLSGIFPVDEVSILLNQKEEDEDEEMFKEESSGDVTETSGENKIMLDFDLVPLGKNESVGKLLLVLPQKLRKEEQALVRLLLPYLGWTLENGLNLVSLEDERRRLDKERYIHEQHLVENKRRNELKKACLSIVTGILPYIDRVSNEVHKLQSASYTREEEVKRGKFRYIDELIVRINEYNEILARWIKMRQGALSLNIENFALNELFLMISKGRRTFEMKRQELIVHETGAVVKADKALTLFMVNTLTENARKYTQEGGRIEVSATETDTYVEISVTDNGPGLSKEDVSLIQDEKVYDSGQIGLATAADAGELKKQKGHGFGLMNCRGIIEKYRKTSPVFEVCLFRVESSPGKGSRFYFRLPRGIRRMLGMCLLVLMPFLGGGCMHSAPVDERQAVPDSIAGYDSLLRVANDYANMVYECNVRGAYWEALSLADSALHYMNLHYQTYSGKKGPLLRLYTSEGGDERDWLAGRFDTDYFILLDVRNEAAVASLAVKDFRCYRYNNTIYTALYKQLTKDTSLEQYCIQMQQSAGNKWIALTLFILLVAGCGVVYYVLYFRRRLHYRYKMEQVFTVNEAIFARSVIHSEALDEIPQRLVDGVFNEICELVPVEGLALAVYDEESHTLNYAFYRGEGDEVVRERMARCFEKQVQMWNDVTGWTLLPLWVEIGGERHCMGVLALKMIRCDNREEDPLLVELVAGYLAVALHTTVVQVGRKYHDIELAQDESNRVAYEENMLHVQNMVLDNCLSTIKHETIYYPNRIQQIVNRLNTDKGITEAEERKQITTVAELVDYYKDIFTLLSSCASRQLEEITFRRSEVPVERLAGFTRKYVEKAVRKLAFRVELEAETEPVSVTGDEILLRFLLENLVDESLRYAQEGKLELKIRKEGEFVRFDFIDRRRNFTQEVLNGLFYPDLARMCPSASSEVLAGTEYLVCKQIIRDHDEFAGRRGCRINAMPAEGGGFSVWFTLPLKRTE